MIASTEIKKHRVKKCDHCGTRNIVCGPESESNPALVCPKCGEHPGCISSYRACPHNPVHRWDEKGVCVRAQATTRKRVKHVVSTGEVAHLWFHQVQDSARNSCRSFFFRGSVIYSWGEHFPIARLVQRRNKTAVLFTDRTSSSSTSGHMSTVRSAIPERTTVFHVLNPSKQRYPGLSRYGGGYFDDAEPDAQTHAENIANYVSRLTTAIDKAGRARSSHAKSWQTRGAKSLRQEVIAYAEFFKLKLPKLPEVPNISAVQLRKMDERQKWLEETRAERVAKKYARDFERWRNGESVTLPRSRRWRYKSSIPTMLRLTADGQEVETSLGARVPVLHAKRALKFVRQVVASGQAYERNGHTFHVGHYAVDRIEPNGELVAGCHRIPFAEIERIAPKLENLADEVTA